MQLLHLVKKRKEQIGITIEHLSALSHLGERTLNRFFAGDDVKLSTVEKVTQVLGLDFAGNEVIDINTLRENRAKEKALYIVSLVQDTCALEAQGLESDSLETLIEETQNEFLHGKYQRSLWAS
jgi:hypothetical protein